MVDAIFSVIESLSNAGVFLLLVEQYVDRVIKVADAVVLLGRGRIGFDATVPDLDQDALMRKYFGES